MSDRLDRAVEFLDKCECLEDTEEYQVAQAMEEQAQWARVKYETYRRAGFNSKAAFALLCAEMSAPTMVFGEDE